MGLMEIAVAGLLKNVGNYLAALAGVGLAPVVTLAPASAGRCAGLLLPGGGDIDPALYGAENEGSAHIDRALDEAQLAMADAFIRAGRPVLGICKGLQVLNVYFGGGLIQDLAVAAAHRYDGADRVHPCASLPDTDMRRLYGRRYAVNSSHHQGLGRMGAGFRATSFSDDGVVESAAHETLPVLGVQWHPERMCFQRARPDTVDGAAVLTYLKALIISVNR